MSKDIDIERMKGWFGRALDAADFDLRLQDKDKGSGWKEAIPLFLFNKMMAHVNKMMNPRIGQIHAIKVANYALMIATRLAGDKVGVEVEPKKTIIREVIHPNVSHTELPDVEWGTPIIAGEAEPKEFEGIIDVTALKAKIREIPEDPSEAISTTQAHTGGELLKADLRGLYESKEEPLEANPEVKKPLQKEFPEETVAEEVVEPIAEEAVVPLPEDEEEAARKAEPESKEKGLESAHEEEDRLGEPPIEAKVVEDDVQKQETTEEATREEGTQETEPEGELPEEPEHDKVHGEVSAEIEAEPESKGYYCPWCDHTAKLGVGCHGKICCIVCGKPINSRFADLLKKARQWDYVIMKEAVTSEKTAQYLGTSTSWAGKVLRELGWEQTKWHGAIWWRWNPPKEDGK